MCNVWRVRCSVEAPSELVCPREVRAEEPIEVVWFGGVSVANFIWVSVASRLALAERSEVRGLVRERSEPDGCAERSEARDFFGYIVAYATKALTP